MARNRTETTVEFKAIVADFNRRVTEVKNSVTTLNREFSLQREEMRQTATQSERLQHEIGHLETKHQRSGQQVAILTEKLEHIGATLGNNSEEYRKTYNALLTAKQQEQAYANQLAITRQKLDDLGGASAQRRQALSELASQERELTNAMESANRQHEIERINLEASAVASGKKVSIVGQHENKLRHLGQQMTRNDELTRNLTQQLEIAKVEYGENSAEVQALERKLQDAERAKADLRLETAKTANEFAKAGGKLADLSRTVTDAGEKMVDAGTSLSKKVTAPLMGIATASTLVGSTFEQAMSVLQATSGASGESLQRLEDAARHMGRTTAFSAHESASALNYMAQAGWDVETSIDALPHVLNMAQSGGLNLSQATNILTESMNQLGLDTSEVERLVDIMAKTSIESGASVQSLGQAFIASGGMAQQMRGGVDEAAVALGLLADAGFKGAQGGTQLRGIMSSLTAPTDRARKAIEEIGLQVFDTEGNIRNMNDIFTDLGYILDNMTQEQRMDIINKLFNQAQIGGVNALLSASGEEWENLADSIDNSTGIAQKKAYTMTDNLIGRMNDIKSALADLGIEIYQILQPYIERVVEIVAMLVEKFNDLSPEMQETVVKAGMLIAVVGPLLILIGKLVIGVGNLITAVGKITLGMGKFKTSVTVLGTAFKVVGALIKKAILALSAPIALIVAAIVGLGVIIIKNWDKIKEFFANLWESLKRWAEDAWSRIKEIFGAMSEWFNERVIQPVLNFFKEMWENVKEFASNAWNGIRELFSIVANWFNENVVQPIIEFFTPLFNFFVELFQSIWDFIASVFEVIAVLARGCWEIIVEVWRIASEWFRDNVVEPLREFFTNLWNNITEFASNAWNNIREIFSIVADWFNENIIIPVTSFFKGLWESVRTGATLAWEGVRNTFNVVATWFNDTLITPIVNFFSGMWNRLVSGATGAWNGIRSVFSVVTDWFRNTFQRAWEGVRNVFSAGGTVFANIQDGISRVFRSVVNGLIGGINRVINVPFTAINRALSTIRNISIVGLTPFSGLPTISVPQIPLLAQGGYIGANKPLLSVIGDNKNEGEIVAPESKIREQVEIALSNQQLIDYDELGKTVAKNIEGLQMSVDSKTFVGAIMSQIDYQLQRKFVNVGRVRGV